jgi:hypothetical protein
MSRLDYAWLALLLFLAGAGVMLATAHRLDLVPAECLP